MTTAAAKNWFADKLQATTLLMTQGKVFLDELPAMLRHWVHNEHSEGKASEEQLCFSLLHALSTTGDVWVGNDVHFFPEISALTREANSVHGTSLADVYSAVQEKIVDKRFCSPLPYDVQSADQLLLPLLCGGETPLTNAHASDVRQHVLRDSLHQASKMQSIYGSSDKVRYALNLTGKFDVQKLEERLRAVDKYKLYTAMKRIGCIGDAVYSKIPRVPPPKGFRLVQNMSIASSYALHVDEMLEMDSL